MSPLLLDTNAAIWLSRDELRASASEKLDEAARVGVATYLSPITAWEVGLLVSRNRLSQNAHFPELVGAFERQVARELVVDSWLLVAPKKLTEGYMAES